jgi:hypothetical protein
MSSNIQAGQTAGYQKFPTKRNGNRFAPARMAVPCVDVSIHPSAMSKEECETALWHGPLQRLASIRPEQWRHKLRKSFHFYCFSPSIAEGTFIATAQAGAAA